MSIILLNSWFVHKLFQFGFFVLISKVIFIQYMIEKQKIDLPNQYLAENRSNSIIFGFHFNLKEYEIQ